MRAASFLPLIFAATPLLAAEGTFPTPFEESRYEQMMQSSPFTLATAPAEAPPPPTESFTANWKLTGVMKVPDEDGIQHDWVSIRSQDQRVAFVLYGDEVSHDPEADGVTIDHIDRNPANPSKTRVFLKKGTDVKPVEFGQEPMAAAPPPPGIPPAARNGLPPAGRPPLPGANPNTRVNLQQNPMGTSGGVLRPPGGNGVTTRPLPHAGPQLPQMQSGQLRPPGAAPIPGLQQQQQQQQQAGKRIRVIPSGPQ